mgnify:CR=1 FL=1
MHIVAKPVFKLFCSITFINVIIILDPEQPRGCPNAIAPPFRLILFSSQSPLRITYKDCAAKASLDGVEETNLSKRYRLEQGYTFEMNLMGIGDQARDAFLDK